MLPRVIPCLLLRDRGLVKTQRFTKPVYLGDPVNTMRIFNDKEVDELVLLDIVATSEGRGPNVEFLAEAASECFIPLAYGGGITAVEQMRRLLGLGIEKVVVNTAAIENPALVRAAADEFGSQSVVVSLDAKRGLLGGYEVLCRGGRKATGADPVALAVEMQRRGAGELLLTSIDRDGTWRGYDLDLIHAVAGAVDVPVVACGGAGELRDFRRAVDAGASAVAAGSLFVFKGAYRAVLISFPARAELEVLFGP